MLDTLKKIFGKQYQPLNKIEINSLFLIHNYTYLASLNPKIKISPVLKSNAYGHGIVQVAKVLDNLGGPFFCVDSIYEAYELLNAGIKTKILIMGYIDPENLKVKRLPFSYAVYNEEQLRVINEYQKGAGIHIKFDSGMHRLGITLEELPNFFEALKLCNSVTLEGFMSHFAESEHPQSNLTGLQTANIMQALELLDEQNIKPTWIHVGNSAATLNQNALQLGTFSNMTRTGLALYGINPMWSHKTTSEVINLKPTLRFTTKIVQIKQLHAGDRVGYNGTFTAKSDMIIAVLPLGYYDGIDRRLSNKGNMIVDGQVCPIIGRISMNIMTIDISTIINPHIGQQVLVFSDNPHDPNSIQNSADLCETIPYDLLVHLASSTRREVV